jgi:hypothetical protein
MTAITPPSVTLPAGDAGASVLPPRIILAIIGLTVGSVLAAVAVFRATGRDWWVLLRDPAAAFDFAPTAGLFSHLGVLAMAVMGAICIFAASLLTKGAQDRGVLTRVGVLSTWLALDDLFMLHEALLPRILGIPEPVTLGIYVVLVAGLMRVIGMRVFTSAFLGFWVAAAFLVVMLGTDMMFEVATSPSFLLEEVTKLCGFLLWAAFWIAFAGRTMRRAMADQWAKTP